MKKITVIILALALVLAPSCKNQKNKKVVKEVEKTEISEKEKNLTEELKANLKNLAESAKQLKTIAFIQKKSDGSFTLTEDEKLVKPDYLVDPTVVDELVTLSQKYRCWTMLGVDKMVCELYDMPVTEYESAIARLIADLNDPAIDSFAGIDWNVDETVKAELDKFVDAEYSAGRAPFMWDAVAASLVEQMYVITRNIDLFMPLFDDQSAADFTYNFVTVHERILDLMEFYPEMENLNDALLPLYVINAITADQLKSQLMELKGEIEIVREFLLN